ncbi:hypothetical protein GCM10011316_34480 [Roseibium aquae]|uniref:Uncharacterized protein n=1 Tax=Roseibium aquae TaxID=1323746 RepID=A0A916X1V0_9HYPH|nr:hypothetical protein [Roseibium aquae]GGB59568.1 hypothetical protein GCM10011316_34480 [Roseibium aquae]
MLDLLIAGYIACAGFVAAGLLGSFYQLLTNHPPRFTFPVESVVGTVVSIVVCMFAGPFIIMRNAIRGRRIENRPLGWLVASSTIAGMWSLCSGIVLMYFALGLTGHI